MNDYTLLTNLARSFLDAFLAKKAKGGDKDYTLKREDVENVVDSAIKAVPDADKFRNDVIGELLSSYNWNGGGFEILADPNGHEPWLTEELKASSKWQYWQRYRRFMLEREMKPVGVVNKVDEITDKILARLESPARQGSWSIRGLVVGSVQSGKTANYVGVINKAIDAGYKFIVVLAGVHSSLRRQTQIRIDETVWGRDSRTGQRLNSGNGFGVGSLDPITNSRVHMLTAASHDFSAVKAQSSGVLLGGDPVILVVKKNKKILGNLCDWLHQLNSVQMPGQADETRRWIPGCPALIIDDEADNASINTSRDGLTAINASIVRLIETFEKAAYIGYTATPYANLYIDMEDRRNIYPRNFIVNIKAPPNYLGVDKVFGVDEDPDVGIEGRDPLPIVRPIGDFEGHIPPKHKSDFTPKGLPQSLHVAIKAFVLASAVRTARRNKGIPLNKHNSMLVHVSHYTAAINTFADLIRTAKDQLKDACDAGDQAFLDDMKSVWKKEFTDVFRQFEPQERGVEVTWDEVAPLLSKTLASVQVRAIHGTSAAALDYDTAQSDGLTVIAVGGNKLSRGLTLESLVVSYYLRTAKLYDTLMQMGRWFGYRDGYVDVCRIYTTQQLIDWYAHVALADQELRNDFDRLAESGKSPLDYGLKVRSHPDGMRITALNKLGNATHYDLTFAGTLVQSTVISTKEERIRQNLDETAKFIASLGKPVTSPDNTVSPIYRNVAHGAVASYIGKLDIPSGANRFIKDLIVRFISTQSEYAQKWSIMFASLPVTSKGPGVVFSMNGKEYKSVSRKTGTSAVRPLRSLPPEYSPAKHNLISPEDQGADLHFTKLTERVMSDLMEKADLFEYQEQLESMLDRDMTLHQVALELTRLEADEGQKTPDVPRGDLCRLLRPDSEALLIIYPITPLLDGEELPRVADEKQRWQSVPAALDKPLIGLAISFPSSDKVSRVQYAVDEYLSRQLTGSNSDEGWEDEEIPDNDA